MKAPTRWARVALNFQMFDRNDIADVVVLVVCVLGLIVGIAVTR